jgi:hypothetical protein
MAQYLLVLCDLDDSPELVASASALARQDPESEFVLLVPATPVPVFESLLGPFTTPTQLGRARAQRLRADLADAGIHPRTTRLGNMDPMRALDDALRFATFDAVVVASPPHRLLHWIHRDVACMLAQRFPDVRFIHAFDRVMVGEHAGSPTESKGGAVR